MTEPGLDGLQAWLQDRVVWQSESDDDEHNVVSSAALPARERIGIYASSYVQRLAECLRAEFPVLRSLIGDQVFNLFAGGYLSARPSRSPSLYDLGAGFADYLEATRPTPHSGPGTMEALPASLARLERARAVSERAGGVEDRASGPFEALTVIADPGARLLTPASLVLLRLDFDFGPTLAWPRDGTRPPIPEPCETLVAVARARYRVQVHPLEPWAFAWLEALAAHDGDVHAATSVSGHRTILARLLPWLPMAANAGFVMR
jgi:hypothetical protein